METDLTYLTTGLFTTFFPESKDGEVVYSQMIEQYGSPKVFTRDLKSTIKQMRDAGYKVSKAKKPTQSIDDILNELETI